MKLNYAELEMTYSPVRADVWEAKKGKEVRFWDRWLDKHAREYDKPSPLAKHLEPLVNGSARIADVCSGACCLIGGYNTIASDILAETYMGMWRRLGIEPAIPIECQDATRLTYADDTFDLVHCRNAIDHSSDPRGILAELVRICRPGGMVYLMHLVNVGHLSHYAGLHRWNVTIDGYVWRPALAREWEDGRWSEECVIGFQIDECLPGAATVKGDRHSRVETKWRKPSDV